ncbi:MAG: hypothetical protein Q8Q14_12305 [Gemmatimonadales bacterium]|nr:hypothetical protein [Gemmatimonadales bacterium]
MNETTEVAARVAARLRQAADHYEAGRFTDGDRAWDKAEAQRSILADVRVRQAVRGRAAAGVSMPLRLPRVGEYR